MQVTIQLGNEQGKCLKETAGRLGITPSALAEAIISDQMRVTDENFDAIVKHVLEKNAELYRRLA